MLELGTQLCDLISKVCELCAQTRARCGSICGPSPRTAAIAGWVTMRAAAAARRLGLLPSLECAHLRFKRLDPLDQLGVRAGAISPSRDRLGRKRWQTRSMRGKEMSCRTWSTNSQDHSNRTASWDSPALLLPVVEEPGPGIKRLRPNRKSGSIGGCETRRGDEFATAGSPPSIVKGSTLSAMDGGRTMRLRRRHRTRTPTPASTTTTPPTVPPTIAPTGVDEWEEDV